jgi:tetratricopeptide (TPR) repeat protein
LGNSDFNKAIQINPEYAEAYSNRGNLYKDQKKWDLAVADYNKAIQINPEDALAYVGKGIVMLTTGNNQKAIQNLQKAAQLSKVQGNTELYELIMPILQKLQK